VRYRQPAVF